MTQQERALKFTETLRKSGFSQQHAATRCGWSNDTLHMLCTGELPFTKEFCATVADKFSDRSYLEDIDDLAA